MVGTLGIPGEVMIGTSRRCSVRPAKELGSRSLAKSRLPIPATAATCATFSTDPVKRRNFPVCSESSYPRQHRLVAAAAPETSAPQAETSSDHTSPEEFRARYEADGVAFGPKLIPDDLISRALSGCYDVMDGVYQTGVAPMELNFTGGPHQLRKIDNVHLSNDAINELVTHPALGQYVSKALGVEKVQCWMVQLLHKPPPPPPRVDGSSEPSTSGSSNAVGWHQDWHYWTEWWREDSEVATVWIALSDVTSSSGPLAFYKGSHHLGYLSDGADFFGDTSKEQLAEMAAALSPDDLPILQEVPLQGILSPGSFSMHHRLTVHGSQTNTSTNPRTAIAVHFVTEHCHPLPPSGDDLNSQLNSMMLEGMLSNPTECPMMWDNRVQ